MKKVLLLMLLFGFKDLSAQQVGGLDNTFDSDGKVTTAFSASSGIYSMVQQPDGKIIAAGDFYPNANSDFALARYNLDGSLDVAFGINGKVTTTIGIFDFAYKVMVQPDEKILIAGRTGSSVSQGIQDYDFVLVRYNSDGSLDNSFGLGGKVTTDFDGNDDRAMSAAIQSDGKIVIVGHSDNASATHIALARYDTDGSLDTSFDYDGKVITTVFSNPDFAYDVSIQADNKILIGGSSQLGGYTIVRYNSNGELDTAFGNNGFTSIDICGSDFVLAIALQSDGKIIAAGTSFCFHQIVSLARFNLDGTIDSSFNSVGSAIIDVGGVQNIPSDVAIQSDDKIVIAVNVWVWGGVNHNMAVVRYNKDGLIDSSFGGDGAIIIHILPLGYSSGTDATILQSDGKILLAGYIQTGQNSDFGIVRLFSGLNIGMLELSTNAFSELVYPNPISHSATLEYSLQYSETISIRLLNMEGKILKTFLENQIENSGVHSHEITMDEGLASGSYLIMISNSKGGKEVVKVVK